MAFDFAAIADMQIVIREFYTKRQLWQPSLDMKGKAKQSAAWGRLSRIMRQNYASDGTGAFGRQFLKVPVPV
jgi:hypothetical protein